MNEKLVVSEFIVGLTQVHGKLIEKDRHKTAYIQAMLFDTHASMQ